MDFELQRSAPVTPHSTACGPLPLAGSRPGFLGTASYAFQDSEFIAPCTLTSRGYMHQKADMSAQENVEYTVKQTAKIHREKPKDPRPSIWLAVAKWTVAIFLFISVLACVVASKISLLSMAHFHDTDTTGSNEGKTNKETLFIMMVVVLMIPEGYTFLKAFWTSLFRKSHKWPSKKAVFSGLFTGALEVFGLCFFTIVIVLGSDKISPEMKIIMMSGVFFVPICWQLYKLFSHSDYTSKETVMFGLALLLEIGGIVVLMIHLHKTGKVKLEKLVGIPIALLFLSIAWCPKIFNITMEPAPLRNPNAANQSVQLIEVELGGSTEVRQMSPGKTARGKAAIIISFWKLLLLPFVAAMFCYAYDGIADIKKLQDGFSDFTVHLAFPHFMVQIFTSFIGYLWGMLACSMCMQQPAFALPLFFATPISATIALVSTFFPNNVVIPFVSDHDDYKNPLVYASLVCFFIAQFLSVAYVFIEQGMIMAKESSLFWMPTYNGVLLEQHLLLNRRNKITDEYQINQRELAEKSCVYICTTMYHEIEQEMEQLLHSLHEIDCARAISMRQIESHIFFDGAVKGEVLNNYVLQLIALIPKTLKVSIEACMKMKTPYGMQMRWRLPGGMFFFIHLKDNLRVKNKKRWSQVMYMSYVLDFKEKQMEVTDENTYILTTDADVKFTHESVEALLDLMMRDPTVGAACGRTHPLGIGPMVWYQIFDYAIGHWFQKVANDVLGSVLCSPGCFSVYRAAALRDVLPIYSTGVDNSFDFLTKDMGEDRWLCTLMVQSGWRLEYCAAAEDSTYCPDSFDEFFKQRRRWIPSTLANLVLLISQWRLTVDNNDFISFPFILYQMLIVFSTVIGPATVILVMVGGLQYGQLGIGNEVVTLVLLILVAVGFAFVCLYSSSDFQLKVAKLLSIVFALLMAVVAVGVAAQAADDLYKRSQSQNKTSPSPTPHTNFTATAANVWLGVTPMTTAVPDTIAAKLPADVSSLYLGGLIGIFFLAALLHLPEAACLIHGLWYLFCLPAGYLLLIIYSICNMTDRSWGTREEKTKKADDVPWYEPLWEKIKYVLMCCRTEPASQTPAGPGKVDKSQPVTPVSSSQEESSDSSPTSEDEKVAQPVQEEKPGADNEPSTSRAADAISVEPLSPPPPKSAMKLAVPRTRRTSYDPDREESERLTKWRYPGDKKVTFASKLPKLHAETPVEDWLHGDLKERYQSLFKDKGYDNVSFIAGMTDKDLKSLGIETRGHRKKLLLMIEKLPQLEIPQQVPENVEDWLTDLGLDEYWRNFEQSGYTEPKMLEDLKIMNKDTLRDDLNIDKQGHLNKLYKAIQKVQYPSEAQRRIRRAREETNKVITMDLKRNNEDNGLEYRFWEGLRELCLMPESAVFGAVSELKEKLEELRDSTLMVFLIGNLIWIILLMTLVKQANLQVLGTNALGLAFLCVFGFIIVIQFLTLLWHRGVTFFHVIARAPWKRGPLHMVWAFDNQNLPPPPSDSDLEDIRQNRGKKFRRRLRRYASASSAEDSSERLLPEGRASNDYGSRNRSLPHLV